MKMHILEQENNPHSWNMHCFYYIPTDIKKIYYSVFSEVCYNRKVIQSKNNCNHSYEMAVNLHQRNLGQQIKETKGFHPSKYKIVYNLKLPGSQDVVQQYNIQGSHFL